MALFGTSWTPIVNASPQQTSQAENDFFNDNYSESTPLFYDYTVGVSQPESTVISPHSSCSNGGLPVIERSEDFLIQSVSS